jgi:hypothetical protein
MQQDVLKLYEAFRKQKARLISPEGQVTTLPASLHDFLVELVGQLSQGHSVSIVQSDAKLSTVDAATVLGTSRQFLVNLLEKGRHTTSQGWDASQNLRSGSVSVQGEKGTRPGDPQSGTLRAQKWRMASTSASRRMQVNGFVAVLDTCVLAPMPVADTSAPG